MPIIKPITVSPKTYNRIISGLQFLNNAAISIVRYFNPTVDLHLNIEDQISGKAEKNRKELEQKLEAVTTTAVKHIKITLGKSETIKNTHKTIPSTPESSDTEYDSDPSSIKPKSK